MALSSRTIKQDEQVVAQESETKPWKREVRRLGLSSPTERERELENMKRLLVPAHGSKQNAGAAVGKLPDMLKTRGRDEMILF